MNTQELKAFVYRLGEQKSVLTEAELLEFGASLSSIDELVETGILYPSAEGIYMPENADFGEHHTRIETLVRFPNTVLCLLSALSFYRLTTQMPRLVWVAYSKQDTQPIDSKLPVEPIAMSNADLRIGVEVHELEGLKVRIFGLAKTVADCFHYQHLVGIDVAQEAFEQAVRENRCTISEIMSYINISSLEIYTQKDLQNCIDRMTVGVV